MLKLLFQLICVMVLGSIFVNCSVAIEKAYPSAGPKVCISKANGFEMNRGDVKYLPNCVKAMCAGNGDIIYHGCGTVLIPENCTFIEPDLTLPYPKCCKTDFIC